MEESRHVQGHKHLLSAYYVLSTVPDAGDTKKGKNRKQFLTLEGS